MQYIRIFYLLQLLNIITAELYLTSNQYNLIQRVIQNPLTTKIERNVVNNILFQSYENWSVHKTLEFKKMHAYKCKYIKNSELILYGKYGLYKSIVKYNGYSSFTNYSSIYINGELNRAITDAFSLSILPKTLRQKSKKKLVIFVLFDLVLKL